MVNLKKIIILLLLIMCADKLNAIYSQEIYYAYIKNRMDLWKNIIEKINSCENKNSDLVLELVDYQYGYIGYCITFDKKEEARIYLARAEENINFLEKQKFMLINPHFME
jgi:hypothetical protein